MTNFNITVFALAIGLTFSVSAVAENMSKTQYKSHVKNIEAEYKAAKISSPPRVPSVALSADRGNSDSPGHASPQDAPMPGQSVARQESCS